MTAESIAESRLSETEEVRQVLGSKRGGTAGASIIDVAKKEHRGKRQGGGRRLRVGILGGLVSHTWPNSGCLQTSPMSSSVPFVQFRTSRKVQTIFGDRRWIAKNVRHV